MRSVMYMMWISVVVLCVALGAVSQGHAQFACPNVPGPYPKPASVLKRTVDKKGGVWKLVCTNKSQAGDFVWTYQPPLGAVHPLGRCIFVDGRNSTHFDYDRQTGNIRRFIHKCIDGGTDDGRPWKGVINVFDKNTSTRRYYCLDRASGKWIEVKPVAGSPPWTIARITTTAGEFASMSSADLDGDSIPDEGFDSLTAGLYSFPPPQLPSLSWSTIQLVSHFNGSSREISWDVGDLLPVMDPGDYVVIHGLSDDDVVWVDSNFTVANDTFGLLLRSEFGMVPTTGMMLVTVQPVGVAPQPLNTYAVVDSASGKLWNAIWANDTLPLDSLVDLTDTLLRDLPGYSSAYGMIDLSVPAPCVCDCHADPMCDGAIDVLDVVLTVGEAFRNGAALVDDDCLHVSRCDVNCDLEVSILDVVTVIAVAFRNANPATEFCNPCLTAMPGQ